MKKTIIILLSFVVAVVLCMSYIPDCFIRKYDLYSGFIGSILAAFVLAWVAWKQLSKIRTTSSADFIHKLTKDFFTSRTRTLITLIECKALKFILLEKETSGNSESTPYFWVDREMLEKSKMPEDLINKLSRRKNYTMWEIDDSLISPLTDVGMLEAQRVLEFKMVYIGFRYYLERIWNYPDIKVYIQWQRDTTKPKSIEHAVSYNFQYIAEKCFEYEALSTCELCWHVKRQILGRKQRSKKEPILTSEDMDQAILRSKAIIERIEKGNRNH
jgi:hypothetical protein